MSIGGGTFTFQNKVLAGAYINTVTTKNIARAGERGITALALELDWGEQGILMKIDASSFADEAKSMLGYEQTDAKLLPVFLALKRAKSCLVFNLNSGGRKASKEIGGITCTAKYAGIRGNEIKVAVKQDIDNSLLYHVHTYFLQREVDIQTVTSISELEANDYVTFSGDSVITAQGATALENGDNGTANEGLHSDFLTALETEAFQTVAYCGENETTKTLYVNFVKRMRDDEGKKIVGVIAEKLADYEGIISVKNGIVLSDGTKVEAPLFCSWVAGASAKADVNQSLTDAIVDDAVAVIGKYKNSVLETFIKQGSFVVYPESVNGVERVKVLADINTHTTFTDSKNEDLTSNRVIRCLDGLANDIARVFADSYVGKQDNNDEGRTLFKGSIVSICNQYQEVNAITNFSASDITITQGLGKRDVVSSMLVQPVDAMEKLYMTINVQ